MVFYKIFIIFSIINDWLYNYNECLLLVYKIWKYKFSFVIEIKYLLLELK